MQSFVNLRIARIQPILKIQLNHVLTWDKIFCHGTYTKYTAIETYKTKTKQKPSEYGSFLWHGQVFLSLAF